MASITFLGTGCGNAQADLGHAAILLRPGDGTTILLDVGEPVASRLLASGARCTDIQTICITHAHVDHISGLPMLLRCNAEEKRAAPLDVHLPATVIEPLNTWLKALRLNPEKLPFELNLLPLRPGETVSAADFTLTAHPTAHLRGEAGTPESHAFVIESAGKRVAYSGDIAAVADLDPLTANRPDVLVSELTHIRPADLCQYLHAKPLGLLALVHLAPTLRADTPSIQDEFETALPQAEEILIPGDGERIEF